MAKKPVLTSADDAGDDIESIVADQTREEVSSGQVMASNEFRSVKPLAERYEIFENQPLPEYATEFAEAYKVEDKKANKTEQQSLYALVFKKGFPVRTNSLYKLVGQRNENFQNILDAGIALIGHAKNGRFCAIVETKRGISLAEIIAQEVEPLSERFVTQKVIGPLTETINFLTQLGVVHGSINLNTIFFDKKLEKITLSECFSSPCGYYQPEIYEPLERACTHPLAKAHYDFNVDNFALGAAAAFCMTGSNPFEGKDQRKIQMQRLTQGSAIVLTESIRQMNSIRDYFKGVLIDYAPERWGYIEIMEWVNRRSTAKSTGTRPIKESLTGFPFAEEKYYGRKSLAQALFLNWQRAKIEIKIEDVIRWLKLNVMRTELAEELESIFPINKRKEGLLTDDDLSRLITTVDPEGPVRYIDKAAEVYGLGGMIAFGFATEKREFIQHVADLFNKNLVHHWLDMHPEFEEFDMNRGQWEALAISKYLRKNSPGFGIERILYELNPQLPCQSQLFEKRCVYDLDELLHTLDNMPEQLHDKVDPVDRHIAAFIAARINLADEIRVKSLRAFPHYANEPAIIMLSLLTIAQYESKIKSLKNLSNWVSKRLQKVVENLHSRSIRKELSDAIQKAARDGSLNSILKVASAPNYIKRDTFGFSEAVRQYEDYTNQVIDLKKQSSLERVAYEYGLKIAVMIGNVACIGTLVLMVMGS